MKKLLPLLAILLVSCSQQKDEGAKSISHVSGDASLYTAQHDGHTFVVVYSGTGLGVIHHPDCPCLKKP